MNNQQKTEALQRMILKFMPKQKRGFMKFDSVAFVENDNPFYSMPFIRCYIKEYRITKNGLETSVLLYNRKNNIIFCIENEDKIYHSIMEFAEKHYQEICQQIKDIQQQFANNIISTNIKATAELTVKRLLNIKRKVEAKQKRKFPPPAIDCRDLLTKRK